MPPATESPVPGSEAARWADTGEPEKRPCDLLVVHGLLVDPVDGVQADGALAVTGHRLVAVGATSDLLRRYRATTTLDATDKIVLPGLINAHTHASATLFRGYAPDVSGSGFFRRLWRIESLLTAEDVYVGALAGCVEMLTHGVTGFANHFSHMDQVARAVVETGIRAGLSRTMLDKRDETHAEAELAAGVEFAVRWTDRCPRVTPMLGPHAAYTCSDKLLQLAAEAARTQNLILHLHLAESPHECEVMTERTGTTTVQHLHRLGFFTGNRVLGAHSLLLTDLDLEVLGRHDYHAAVCTAGKMNRGQGIAALPRLLTAGVNVCLGTDGSASDTLDVLQALKTTHLAQNYLHRQVAILAPETLLGMATHNAASALRWNGGRLAPGRLADFLLLDTNRPHLRPLILAPRSNVVFNVVYYATGADVETVVVDGRLVKHEGKVLTVDVPQVLRRVQRHAQRLWRAAAAD